MMDRDLEETALAGAGDPPASQARRRQIIDEIVRTLAALAEGLEGQNGVSQESIGRLIGILQTMSDGIASADDATFNAIMREAALLIRAVRDRQAYFSQFTVH
ncbi:hypothetical protein [Rhizobiales bacterium]|uniref:hypothetical protein n=1 Tax=unclassified Rhizobium TaxID=2613769 RepID=UPI000DDDE89F